MLFLVVKSIMKKRVLICAIIGGGVLMSFNMKQKEANPKDYIISDLLDRIVLLEAEVNKIKGSAFSLPSISELENKVKDNESDINKIKGFGTSFNSLSSLESNISDLESNVSSNENEISSLKSNVSNNERAISSLKSHSH